MRSLGLHPTTLAPASAAFATSSPRSPWHSPVSYLFGGLAAMTGLIAFALLILACSYCHLSGAEDDDARRRQDDVEQGKTGEGGLNKVSPVFEEKFLVIMAGHHIPTFLATPRFSRASLLAPDTVADKTSAKVAGGGDQNPKEEEEEEETEQVNGHDRQSTEVTSSQRDETD